MKRWTLPSVVREADWRAKLRWFGAEILIVVAGVLIALALNAWWAERQRESERNALVQELRADVENTRDYTQRVIGWRRGAARHAREILTGLSAGVSGTARDTLLANVGSVFAGARWHPVHDTYVQSLGSGRLALITDPDLRSALGHYHARSDALGEIAEFVSARYIEREESFLVENAVYSEVAYDLLGEGSRLVTDSPHRTDFEALAANPELWNLLSLKFLVEDSYADELTVFDSLSVDLLRLLNR